MCHDSRYNFEELCSFKKAHQLKHQWQYADSLVAEVYAPICKKPCVTLWGWTRMTELSENKTVIAV